MSTSYDYTRDAFLEALMKMQFPERTTVEASLYRDWGLRHATEYDSYQLSVRVGKGIAPDPTHDQGVQDTAAFSSKKRIDILAWKGSQPYLFEVKQRLIPAALGQLLTYRHLWMEENPDAKQPILGAIARTSDDDTNRVMQSNGVTIYLIPATTSSSGTTGSGVPADNSGAASG